MTLFWVKPGTNVFLFTLAPYRSGRLQAKPEREEGQKRQVWFVAEITLCTRWKLLYSLFKYLVKEVHDNARRNFEIYAGGSAARGEWFSGSLTYMLLYKGDG